MLGTFSEGVFGVHAEFTAVRNFKYYIDLNITPFVITFVEVKLICQIIVSKIHSVLPWTEANVDVVQTKRREGGGKLLFTYNCNMFS